MAPRSTTWSSGTANWFSPLTLDEPTGYATDWAGPSSVQATHLATHLAAYDDGRANLPVRRTATEWDALSRQAHGGG